MAWCPASFWRIMREEKANKMGPKPVPVTQAIYLPTHSSAAVADALCSDIFYLFNQSLYRFITQSNSLITSV